MRACGALRPRFCLGLRTSRAWLALLLLAPAARADEPPPHPASSADPPGFGPVAPSQRVAIEAAPAEIEALLAEILGRIGVTLVHADTLGDALATVTVHARGDGGLHVVVRTRRGRVSVDRVFSQGKTVALQRETVAHVVLGAVEPLTLSPEPALTPPKPTVDEGAKPAEMASVAKKPEVAPPPSDEPSPRARTREPEGTELHEDSVSFALGPRAGPRWFGSGLFGVALGAGASLASRQGVQPGAELEVGAAIFQHVSAAGIEGDLIAVPIRLGARVAPWHSPTWAFETRAGGGLDVLSLSTTSTDPLVVARSPSPRVQPIVFAGAAARWRFSDRASAVLALGVDLDLAPRAWLVEAPPRPVALAETARVRPFATLGVDFDLTASSVPARKEARAP